MIVTGGTHVSGSRQAIAAYDPVADRRRIVVEPPIDGRHWHSAVWMDEEVVVWAAMTTDSRSEMGPPTTPSRPGPRRPAAR